jgi:hypothetical protein
MLICFEHTQADTDLLSDRRARMEEWREWYEGKRAHREQMAAAAQRIIAQRYPALVDKPDDYTIEQVGVVTNYVDAAAHALILGFSAGIATVHQAAGSLAVQFSTMILLHICSSSYHSVRSCTVIYA